MLKLLYNYTIFFAYMQPRVAIFATNSNINFKSNLIVAFFTFFSILMIIVFLHGNILHKKDEYYVDCR